MHWSADRGRATYFDSARAMVWFANMPPFPRVGSRSVLCARWLRLVLTLRNNCIGVLSMQIKPCDIAGQPFFVRISARLIDRLRVYWKRWKRPFIVYAPPSKFTKRFKHPVQVYTIRVANFLPQARNVRKAVPYQRKALPLYCWAVQTCLTCGVCEICCITIDKWKIMMDER